MQKVKRFFNPVVIIVLISLLLNVVVWILAVRYFPKESPATILHYNSSVGIDFIGEGGQIVVIPSIGLIIIACNTVMGLILRSVSRRAAWMFWGVTPFVQIVLLVAFGLIWYLNI